jgi:ELWxxDGT repeat protein
MHKPETGRSGAIVETIEPRLCLSAGLLTDINHHGGSKPRYLTDLNGVLYFSADDGIHGRELWRADGTGKGTAMVKDLVKGGKGSNPVSLTNLGGTLYFATDNAITGTSFWKSDGTANGTVLIKQISTQRGGLSDFTLAGGTIYFQDANLQGNVINLYASDGTAAGTRVIQTATDQTLDEGETFQHLTAFKRNLFFFDVVEPNIGLSDSKLFRTDGVQNNAMLLGDFDDVTDAVVFNGALYFGVIDPNLGDGLWKSDGTAAGTKRVAALGLVQNLAAIGDTLYFSGQNAKHGSEPYTFTPSQGVQILKDVNPGVGASNPIGFTSLNAKVIFSASDGKSGVEPWITDGTAAGTHILKDIDPRTSTSPFPSGSSFPSDFTVSSDKVYFTANDFRHGLELWQTDGTSNGTQRISDFIPGRPSSDVANLTDVDGTLFFTFNDGVHGLELGVVRNSGPTM